MSDFDDKLVETREAAREQIGGRLEACLRLRDFAVGLHKPWGGRPIDDGRGEDLLIVSLFVRTFATYSALVELLTLGYGTQAAMLNRSLFEDMVDLHWIRAEPALALQRIAEHHEHSKMILGDTLAKYPAWYADIPLEKADQARRKELNAIFTPYGTRSWTNLNTHDRLTAAIGQWPGPEEQHTVRWMYDIPYRESNQALHVTSQSLSDLVQSNGPGGLVLSFGPDTSMLKRAVTLGYWTFVQSVGLHLTHFEFQITEDERDEALSMVAFVDLTAEQVRDTERNDPCPCESGEKFKRCHGA